MAVILVVVFLLVPLLQPPVLAQAPGNLRLSGGLHPYEGRIEIFLNSQWGTICDDGWSRQDADVACRQLGFSNAVRAVHGGFYGAGNGEIWLDEVACKGTESSLLTCSMIAGQHDCSHDEDAGVVCLMPDMIQLVGEEPNQGRLEINHDGYWGTVCHDHFDEQDGTIVCQQLGYTKLRGYSQVNETSRKQGVIWLDDVNCSTSHVRLSECNSRGWGITDCRYSDAVSVACEGVPMEPYRPVVTETSCTNAMIEWRLPSADNGRHIHQYYVRYREDGQSNWTYIRHHSLTPSHHGHRVDWLNVTIYDLKPATSYEVAIAANNMIGNSSYSQSVTMVTQEIAFDPPVMISVDNVGCGMLNVKWTHSAAYQCGLSPTLHWIEYSSPSGHSYHQLVEDNSTDVNYTITNLSVDVEYNISVRVGMAMGERYVFSGPSETFVASTKPTKAPVVAPGQFSAYVINVSTVLFSWQCTEEYKTGYIILCYHSDNPLNFWTRNVTADGYCHYLEHDISNNVMYTCMVASVNEIGPSNFSDSVKIVPDSIPLNPTPSVTQWTATVTSVTMTIEQGSHKVSDGYVVTETVGYDVTCQSLSILRHVTVWGGVVDATVEGLLPDRNYTCDITAISKCGLGSTTTITVTTAGSAPTGTPRHLFISDQVDALYLHWLPPATDQQHGIIIDYNVSCVTVEEGRDPHDPMVHDSNNAWTMLVTQLGTLPGNDKSINVAMPMFTPFQLLSCRVAGINKNGQGPYKYYIGIVNPPGITVKVEELQAHVTTNNIVSFQWQPLSEANISQLAVKGYLLQCNAHDHTWERTIWESMLSIATVEIRQFLTNHQYNCSIAVFNPVGHGLHSNPVQLQIHEYSNDDNSQEWYDDDIVVYVLLSLIGVTMVIIVLLLVCLCYCTCHHRNRPLYTAKNEISDNSTPVKTADNELSPSYSHYESLDNLYDKTPPPNNKIQSPDKMNNSVDDDHHGDDELPAEEEYMKMTPSRSCSHVTIKSDTLRSCDLKLNQMDYGYQDNRKAIDPHQDSQRCNSLPSHYDVPTNNSHHSNNLKNNYYDTPRSNKLARTK